MLESLKNNSIIGFESNFKKEENIPEQILKNLEEYNSVKYNNFFKSCMSFFTSSFLLFYMGQILMLPFLKYCFGGQSNILGSSEMLFLSIFMVLYFGSILSLFKLGIRDVKNSFFKWRKKKKVIEEINAKSFKLEDFFKSITKKVIETNNIELLNDFNSLIQDFKIKNEYSISKLNEFINKLNFFYSSDLEITKNKILSNFEMQKEVKNNNNSISLKEKISNII